LISCLGQSGAILFLTNFFDDAKDDLMLAILEACATFLEHDLQKKLWKNQLEQDSLVSLHEEGTTEPIREKANYCLSLQDRYEPLSLVQICFDFAISHKELFESNTQSLPTDLKEKWSLHLQIASIGPPVKTSPPPSDVAT
jgi:hypothetical protein